MLIEHENLGSNFATDVKILGHVNLMKVAGKQTEIFLEQMVVRKVGIFCGEILGPYCRNLSCW